MKRPSLSPRVLVFSSTFIATLLLGKEEPVLSRRFQRPHKDSFQDSYYNTPPSTPKEIVDDMAPGDFFPWREEPPRNDSFASQFEEIERISRRLRDAAMAERRAPSSPVSGLLPVRPLMPESHTAPAVAPASTPHLETPMGTREMRQQLRGFMTHLAILWIHRFIDPQVADDQCDYYESQVEAMGPNPHE
jgi:hypothetical protein